MRTNVNPQALPQDKLGRHFDSIIHPARLRQEPAVTFCPMTFTSLAMTYDMVLPVTLVLYALQRLFSS